MKPQSAQDFVTEAYDLWSHRLMAYGLSLGFSRSDAQDALHSVFLSLFKVLKAGNTVKATQSYLYKSFRSFLLRSQSRIRRQKFWGPGEWEKLYSLGDENLMGAEDFDRLGDALLKLPPEQREIIELHYFHDLPFPEIADLLGLPLNTAMSRSRLGLEKLKREFETMK